MRRLQTAKCGRAAYDVECRRRIDQAHQQLCRHAAELRKAPATHPLRAYPAAAALVNPTVVTVPATPLSHSSGECEYIPIAYLTPPSEWPFGTPRIVRL